MLGMVALMLGAPWGAEGDNVVSSAGDGVSPTEGAVVVRPISVVDEDIVGVEAEGVVKGI
jgi:hypothetical protein